MPRLFGLRGQPRVREGRILEPMDGWGVKVMSIGFLVDDEAAMVWRGPMIQSAIGQMLKDVAWGELDVLVVDMPPGTGDAQLALAQQVPISGAVIVSTPQDLALIDARRGVAMFRKVGVPILGVIENMAVYVCPTCGTQAHLFGEGGAKAEAARMGVTFLGAAPLDMAIRVGADAGRPVAAVDPDGPQGRIYAGLAENVFKALVSL
jgi:ATP-binding protein involved in chromosome partitioning